LWKAELAVLAAETGLTITVCHFPPGTSQWNKIEHRLFWQIHHELARPPADQPSDRPSHQIVVATIASTRTRTGLRVHAELDPGSYPLGLAVFTEQLRRPRDPPGLHQPREGVLPVGRAGRRRPRRPGPPTHHTEAAAPAPAADPGRGPAPGR
jgi:hypothetical protein